MTALVRLLLITVLPTAVAAGLLALPRLLHRGRDLLRRHRRTVAGPVGPPLERTAADLRRLLEEHHALRTTAGVPSRAARLRALEGAIGDAACDAARAVDVPLPVRNGRAPLPEAELHDLLAALVAAGLVLPHACLGRR